MYLTRGYDNHKYICPQQGSSKLHKPTLNQNKGTYRQIPLIVGDLSTPLSAIDRSPTQKIHKETRASNDILDQMDLIDVCRTLHPRTTEYPSFSNALGTFSRIDHIRSHKTGLKQCQRLRLIPAYLRPQCFDIGTQSQGKRGKKLKHLETKNHSAQE